MNFGKEKILKIYNIMDSKAQEELGYSKMDSEIVSKAQDLGYSTIVTLLNVKFNEREYNDLVLICNNNIYKTKLMEFLLSNDQWNGIYLLIETVYDENINFLLRVCDKCNKLSEQDLKSIIMYSCNNNNCVILKYLFKRALERNIFLPDAVNLLCTKGNIQTLNMIVDNINICMTDILYNSKAIEIALQTKNNALLKYLSRKFDIRLEDLKDKMNSFSIKV